MEDIEIPPDLCINDFLVIEYKKNRNRYFNSLTKQVKRLLYETFERHSCQYNNDFGSFCTNKLYGTIFSFHARTKRIHDVPVHKIYKILMDYSPYSANVLSNLLDFHDTPNTAEYMIKFYLQKCSSTSQFITASYKWHGFYRVYKHNVPISIRYTPNLIKMLIEADFDF